MTTAKKRSSAPTPIDLQIINRIRSIRLQSGLSQGDVAKHLGIVHQQYHKYESGLNRVSAGMLVKLAEVLKCQVTDLIPPEMNNCGQIAPEMRIDVLKQELVDLVLDCGCERKLIAIRTLLVEN